MERVDVVVVGAGLAGLSAARRLHAAGASVVVLEAHDEVGGRTRTTEHEGFRFDLGGQWVGPTQGRVLELAATSGVSTFPTYTQGEKVLVLGDRRSTYSKTIPKLSPLKLLSLQAVLSSLERGARRTDPADPWTARSARGLDGRSVGDWLVKRARHEDVRDLVSAALRVIFGAEPQEVSLLYTLAYAKAAGSFMELIETSGGAQDARFVEGAQELSLRLAREMPDTIVLRSPARRIEREIGGVIVRTDREAWHSDRVVIAMAPAVAHRIDYHPALPSVRDGLMQRFPMGSTIKCHAFYDRPFWRDRGWSGEAVLTGGPVSAVFDNGSADGSRAALLAFVVGAAAYELGRMDLSERRRVVLTDLERAFGAPAGKADHYVDHDWGTEEWVHGCPTGFATPGALTSFGHTLREPIGPLHWAGTETSTEWCGYMEGALASGERAAAEVIAALDRDR